MNSTAAKATVTMSTTNAKQQTSGKVQTIRVYDVWGKAREIQKVKGIQI